MASKSKRVKIPKSIGEAVLRDFRHRCAICGTDRPQLHHIDEDPSNSNDPLNLLPLCPNHHLQDQHDPTAPMDKDKLRLFRIHRDPLILHPRFHPIWLRCRFLLDVENLPLHELRRAASELFHFIGSLEMGSFYVQRLMETIKAPPSARVITQRTSDEELQRWENEESTEYRSILKENRDKAFTLIVEMLRYQNWPGTI